MSLSDLRDFLFRPPLRLFHMATGFWVSQTLFAAVELEVFTLLDLRPLSLGEFCAALGIESRAGQALLGALAALGLVKSQGGSYRNAPIASRWLVKGRPEYLGDGVMMLRDRLYDPWGRLSRAVRTNSPTSFDSSVGELFDYLDEHSEEQTKFVQGMQAISLIPARALARRFSFKPFRHLADLGGGSGVYAIEVLRRFPHLRATVVERPPICEIAREYIRSAGLENQIATESRDIIHDPLPEGVDVALLSQVLHDYSPQENADLLRHLAEQLPARGALLMSEWLLREDGAGPLAASLMFLNMLIDTRGGRGYRFSELGDLLRRAGFRSVKQQPLYGPAQLVIARKS